MHNLTSVLLLTSLFSLASCSSNDDSSSMESSSEMSSNTNQEQTESEGTITDQMLISTASLTNSGNDNEVPVLVAKSSFSFTESAQVALSPDGSEFAIVKDFMNTEGTLAIYSTETEMLLRSYPFPIAETSSRAVSILWGQDDILTLIWRNFVGQVLNTRTGEVLVTNKNAETEACELGMTAYLGFNPVTNKLYCASISNEQVSLMEIDTRTLTRQVVNTFTASSILSGVRLSHDGSEMSLTVNESAECCLDPTTLFVSTENFELSREKQMNGQSNQVMGDGFDINFDELLGRFYLGDDGTYIDADGDEVFVNSTNTLATVVRPKGEDIFEFEGRRVFTLPEGVVVGDIISPGEGEIRLMSIDGSVVVFRSMDNAAVYDTDSRTNYTVLTK